MEQITEETDVQREQAVKNVIWLVKNYKNRDSIGSGFFRIEEFKTAFFIMLFKSKLTKNCYENNDIIVTFQVVHLNQEKALLNPVKINLSIGTIGEQKVFVEIKMNTSAFGYSVKECSLLPFLTHDGSLPVNIEIKSYSPSSEKQYLSEGKNFKLFLKNRSPGDVVFKINEKEIPAHKIVLASVSSIFDKMFFHQKESNFTNVVEIDGVDSNVFQEFLDYIYNDRVESLENVAVGLYELANMYGLPDLQAICEEHLCQSLLVDNVISVLHLADRHNSVNLKKTCFEYMDTHFDQVRETESFINLKKDGELLMEFLCATRMKKPRH